MPPALLTSLDGCKSSDIASKSTQQDLFMANMSHCEDLLQYLNSSDSGERVGSTTDPLHATLPDSSSDHPNQTLTKLWNGDTDHSDLLPDTQPKIAGFDTSITLKNFLNTALDGPNVNDFAKIETSQTLQEKWYFPDNPMNSVNGQPRVYHGTTDALMTSVASSLPSDLHGLKMEALVSQQSNFSSTLSQGDSSNSSFFAAVSTPMDTHKDMTMAAAFSVSDRSQGTTMMDTGHCDMGGQQSYEGTPQMRMVDFEGALSVETVCRGSEGLVLSLALSGMSSQSPMGQSVSTISLTAPRCTTSLVSSELSPSAVSSSNSDYKGSMLRHLLTGEIEVSSDSASPQSSHDEALNSPSSVSSPGSLYHDCSTQATLIQRSEQLRLNSEASLIVEDSHQHDLWSSVLDTTMMESPNKAHKAHRGADAHSSIDANIPSVESIFDASGASSPANFMFEKFGTDPGVFPFSAQAVPGTTNTAKTISTSSTDTRVVPVLLTEVNTGRSMRSGRRLKEPSLSAHYPAKAGGAFELRLLSQPEDQHRARYLTEGSRGAVKDRTGQGFPVVKLTGHNDPVTLQVYVGNENGRVKPHGFYQACRVCGKNSTPCSEREIDGTVVIEMDLMPLNDMSVSIDCVGILKLRNADVEKRIGVAKAKAKKKNNTRARLVFRTSFQKPDGAWQTLQIASAPILCTQPVGQPEISRMSLHKSDVSGGDSLFIIGKNFLKGTEIIFQEASLESGDVVWQKEAEVESEHFQSTHLICTVPSYCNKHITTPVQVQIVASCGGKMSEPQQFCYQPLANPPTIKQEVPMETDAPVSKALSFGVSPVALELNRAVEQMQQGTSGSSGLFQLPAGMVAGIDTTPSFPAPSLTPTSLTVPQSSPVPTPPAQPAPAPSLQMIGAGGGGQMPQVFLVNPGSGSTPASAQIIPLGGSPGNGQAPMIIVLPSAGQAAMLPLQQQQQQPSQQQQQQQQQSQQQTQAMLQQYQQLQLQLQALLQQKQQQLQQQQSQQAAVPAVTAQMLQQLLQGQILGGGQFQPQVSVPQNPQPTVQGQQVPQSPLVGQIPQMPMGAQIPASPLSLGLQSSAQDHSMPTSPAFQGGNMPPSPMQTSQTAPQPGLPHSDSSNTLNLQGSNMMSIDAKTFLHILTSQANSIHNS